MIRCRLGVESSIQMVCLIQSCNHPNSRPIPLPISSDTLVHHKRRQTEVAKDPVLQTVITFNPFFPSFPPPLFCHNHSAPFFPISIHLARSSPWTALHPSLTFSLSSSPDSFDCSPCARICRRRLRASDKLTAVGREDWRWSRMGLR
jgi:hypothetical protein